MKKIYFLFFIATFFYGCSETIPVHILPNNNADLKNAAKDSINTAEDEIAPYQKPWNKVCRKPALKEFAQGQPASYNLNDGVRPSYKFLEDIFGKGFIHDNSSTFDYLTKKVESVSFITENEGFIAFSHPPDANFTEINRLPFKGMVGGTDLFHFSFVDNKYQFDALPVPVNSEFWDSHCWAGQDSACNIVLVWSSDRNNPYTKIWNKNDSLLGYSGNTDLFYSFKIAGKWTAPKFFEIDENINTSRFNEFSPYVSCLCFSPVLFFSSNRPDSTQRTDYDIFAVKIKIDFAEQSIAASEQAQRLPKTKQENVKSPSINSDADEIFPMLAYPYLNNVSRKKLYLSSNRNIDQYAVDQNKDTLLYNKGGFDIYQFLYDLECKAPPPPPPVKAPEVKVQLVLRFKDALNPSSHVLKPVAMLSEPISQQSVEVKDLMEAGFILDTGRVYYLKAGSGHNGIFCNDAPDKVINYYEAKEVSELEPKIIKRVVKIEYDTLVEQELKNKFDTTTVVEIYPADEADNIKAKENEKSKQNGQIDGKDKEIQTETTEIIKDVKYNPCFKQCDTVGAKVIRKAKQSENAPEETKKVSSVVEVRKQVITKKEWYEGGKLEKKSITKIEYDTIRRYDTTWRDATGPVAQTELTHVKPICVPGFDTKNLKKDTTIFVYDTVYLHPQYFEKPPCNCDFVSYEHPFNKTVPYFQTAFWEVNTTQNIKDHLERFSEWESYSKAGFIELHPKNPRFGEKNPEDREKRIKEYQKEYAPAVDKNLNYMKDVIVKQFLPAFEIIDKATERSKLLVKLEAYSDRRPAGRCKYVGKNVNYIEGKWDKVNRNIPLSNINIPNGSNLGNDNDNLSKLRVYYGFNELFDRLKKDAGFSKYLKEGLVFYPTMEFKNDEERASAFKKAKIIIICEGKYFDDEKVDEQKYDWESEKSNFFDYDKVRRLNLYIDIINYENGFVNNSPCCDPAKPCPPLKKK